MEKVALLSRVKTCAIGALLGDVLGAAYEGQSKEEIGRVAGPLGVRNHKEATHMGVYHLGARIGCYTDDTNSAIALLRSMSSLGKLHGGDVGYWHARQWIDGYALNFVRGYPNSAQAMMLETLKGSSSRDCATISFKDGSFANGAAMKIWPVAVAMHDVNLVPKKEFYTAVSIACCYSHVHPQAIDAAACLGETIRWALSYKINAQDTDAPWDFFVDGAVLLDVAFNACQDDVVREKVGNLRQATRSLPPPSTELLTPIIFTQEASLLFHLLEPMCGKSINFQIEGWSALVCALGVVARHGPNVGDVIAYAVALGGDTDTVASMAGAISGALCGDPEKCCDPSIWGRIENNTKYGLLGREWLVETAVSLAQIPLTEFVPPKPGESAANSAPRSIVDTTAEICGMFWRTPQSSDGFDSFREKVYFHLGPQNASDARIMETLLPFMLNRVGSSYAFEATKAFKARGIEETLDLESWMRLTDPHSYDE